MDGSTRPIPQPRAVGDLHKLGLRSSIGIVFVVILVGAVLRYLVLDHTTFDTDTYVVPWYKFARDNGFSGLKQPFTNYTPFYSYLLLAASMFDGFAPPLHLIKAISAVFEFGCALVVAELVWHTTRAAIRAACAFAALWLAPTVLLNGALWGQADSIWTFFVLLSISLFARGRNGILPFAMAVAIKAQAVFLGPFILGLILRRRVSWMWLAAVPIVYFAFAVPVLVAGRSLSSIFAVYMDQADYYHDVSKGAANPWLFLYKMPYTLGLRIGVTLGALGGVAVAIRFWRGRSERPLFILLAACVSLFAMPFLLPKMHDRFFYGFELAAVALACLDRRFIVFAILAQLDGVLAGLGSDFKISTGVKIAALCNIVLSIYLVRAFAFGGYDVDQDPEWRGAEYRVGSLGRWLWFAASAAALVIAVVTTPRSGYDSQFLCLLAGTATLGGAVDLLRLASDRTAHDHVVPPAAS